jgi:hypothetical protein
MESAEVSFPATWALLEHREYVGVTLGIRPTQNWFNTYILVCSLFKREQLDAEARLVVVKTLMKSISTYYFRKIRWRCMDRINLVLYNDGPS